MSETAPCIDFSPALVALAQRRRAQMPKKLRNSVTGGRGTLVGLVGEYCAAAFLRTHKIPAEIRDTYDYDIVAGPTKLKLEVKSMNVRSAPRPNNLNPVCIKNAEQQADYYIFMRVAYKDRARPNLGGRAFFCGAVPCCKLKVWGRLYQEGQIDSNGYPVRFASYNTAIEKCLDWSSLRARLVGTVSKKTDMAEEPASGQVSGLAPGLAPDQVPETAEAKVAGKLETGRKRGRTELEPDKSASWDTLPPLLVLKSIEDCC